MMTLSSCGGCARVCVCVPVCVRARAHLQFAVAPVQRCLVVVNCAQMLRNLRIPFTHTLAKLRLEVWGGAG